MFSARGLGVGNLGAEILGVKVGALKLTLDVGNGNPSDGGLTDEMLNDESTTVDFDILRLREGIVKDGIVRDVIIKGVAFKDGRLIVGLSILRPGDETVSDGIPRDGMTGDGKLGVGRPNMGLETFRLEYGMVTGGASTEGNPCDESAGSEGEGMLVDGDSGNLFVGIPKIGSAVGVAGKPTIGRPKESTLEGVIGTESMLGTGTENGGGSVTAVNPIEDEVSEGRKLGLPEGRPNEYGLPMSGIRVAEPGPADVTVVKGISTPLG